MQDEDQLRAMEQGPRHAGVGVRIGAGIVDFVVLLAIPVTLVLCLIFGVSECVDAVLSQIDPEREPVGESTLNTLNIIAGVILAIITVVLWVNWD